MTTAKSAASRRREREYEKKIISRMTALGVYREEFTETIQRTAALYVLKGEIEEKFAQSGGGAVVKHTNKAGATNLVKNPFLSARDEVYSQILAHERELGLTPSALKKLNESALRGRKTSTLGEALRELSG